MTKVSIILIGFISTIIIAIMLINITKAYDVGAATTFSDDTNDLWFNATKQIAAINGI